MTHTERVEDYLRQMRDLLCRAAEEDWRRAEGRLRARELCNMATEKLALAVRLQDRGPRLRLIHNRKGIS